MLDGNFRAQVDSATERVATHLPRTRLTANSLTLSGLALATATAWLIGTGRLAWAFLALLSTGLCDLLDGPVARATKTSSPRGAYLDSVADRVTEALVLGGLAWYLASPTTKGYAPHLAILPLAILAVAFLISYQRAKAESLGLVAKGGLMERGERLVLLAIALLFSAVLVPLLWLLLSLSLYTAVVRYIKVASQTDPAPTPMRAPNRSTHHPSIPRRRPTRRPEALSRTSTHRLRQRLDAYRESYRARRPLKSH